MPTPTVQGRRAFAAHRRPAAHQQPARTEKPALVFLHGAGGSHQHWLYQLRDLTLASPQATTYALDLPGHGRSEGPGRDSIQGYGDWVVDFFDAACLGQAVLVGHSMGGAIALDVALRHGDRVAGLGLVATGARLRVAPQILNGVLEDKAAAVELICKWAYGPEAQPEMVRLGRRQMAGIPRQVFHGDFVACDGFDVMDRLGDITQPTFVLCGTKDRLTPAKYSTALRDGIAGASLHLIEGAGHMVMIEKPVAVERALSAFLDRL